MKTTLRESPALATGGRKAHGPQRPAGHIVLVLQGGGAVGAYQAGVYQALSEGGIEPDWVIGTSIGAIDAAIIAGNAPAARRDRLQEFWSRVGAAKSMLPASAIGTALAGMRILAHGVPGFFEPNLLAGWNLHFPFGVEHASFYTTGPLKATLAALVDFDYVNAGHTRLTVGAVHVRTGRMHYFDSRDTRIGLEHVMASGALPPGFPAVRIDGDAYWDGGLYSNTPVEVVLDDRPRRDSLIFSVNLWHASGAEPDCIWQVLRRQKDIQYASRVDSHIAKQEQIHQLRRVIRELAKRIPADQQGDPDIQELASYGCRTTMHVVRLFAPRFDHEDHTVDIDFTPSGIRRRWDAGYADTLQILERQPWHGDVEPLQAVVVHQLSG